MNENGEQQQQQQQQQQPTVEQLVAEAEERGYKRGRNEQIAMRMSEPSVWEPTDRSVAEAAASGGGGYQVLGERRRSIWER
jgi:membrane-bound ClpP family serine protease